MPTLLPESYLSLLCCPCDGHGELSLRGDCAVCLSCGRELPVGAEGILEFVDVKRLDAATAQELEGNLYSLSDEQIVQLTRKEKAIGWKSFYSRSRRGSLRHLAKLMAEVDCDQVFFLGTGTGRDIAYLTNFCELNRVFCSDLSVSALRIALARLDGHGVHLGLFTSDLQECPIKSRDIPIVVVNALHHTQDMHLTIDAMLCNSYNNIFLVEPTDNFLIHFLAKKGLAQRKEYSGVIPGRLDLKKLATLCRHHNYRLSVRTEWIFPGDYYRKMFPKGNAFQTIFFLLLDAFSMLTGLVKVGNQSVVHIQRRQS